MEKIADRFQGWIADLLTRLQGKPQYTTASLIGAREIEQNF
jgi:hypothetical protein